jgi:hypothetical protein
LFRLKLSVILLSVFPSLASILQNKFLRLLLLWLY